eukprot:3808883-Rhodomonas_salina.4
MLGASNHDTLVLAPSRVTRSRLRATSEPGGPPIRRSTSCTLISRVLLPDATRARHWHTPQTRQLARSMPAQH